MATHSSVLALRIPGTGKPGGLPSVGSHRVGHDWSDLAAAAGYFLCCCRDQENQLDVDMATSILKSVDPQVGASISTVPRCRRHAPSLCLSSGQSHRTAGSCGCSSYVTFRDTRVMWQSPTLCCFLRILYTWLMRTSGRRLGNREIYLADERGEVVFFARIIPRAKDVAQRKLFFWSLFSSWYTQSLRNYTHSLSLSLFFLQLLISQLFWGALCLSSVSWVLKGPALSHPVVCGHHPRWLFFLPPPSSFLGLAGLTEWGHAWPGTAKFGLVTPTPLCAMVTAHPSKTVT